MAQPKGSTGNPNGRPIGSKNKVSEEIRQTINDFLNNNISTIQESFDTLEPYQKIQSLIKLLDYSIPRLKTIDIESSFKESESNEPLIKLNDFSKLTETELREWKRLQEKACLTLREDNNVIQYVNVSKQYPDK